MLLRVLCLATVAASLPLRLRATAKKDDIMRDIDALDKDVALLEGALKHALERRGSGASTARGRYEVGDVDADVEQEELRLPEAARNVQIRGGSMTIAELPPGSSLDQTEQERLREKFGRDGWSPREIGVLLDPENSWLDQRRQNLQELAANGSWKISALMFTMGILVPPTQPALAVIAIVWSMYQLYHKIRTKSRQGGLPPTWVIKEVTVSVGLSAITFLTGGIVGPLGLGNALEGAEKALCAGTKFGTAEGLHLTGDAAELNIGAVADVADILRDLRDNPEKCEVGGTGTYGDLEYRVTTVRQVTSEELAVAEQSSFSRLLRRFDNRDNPALNDDVLEELGDQVDNLIKADVEGVDELGDGERVEALGSPYDVFQDALQLEDIQIEL